jgi:flagellar hook-associated protein 2
MSAVTFSGANGIDFNVILNAVMTQERAPLDNLTAQQKTLKTQSSAFSTLASKLGTIQSAAEALTRTAAFGGRTVTSTDESTVAASGGTDAVPGIYDVVVNELARAQVTATSSRAADTGTTTVATGGTLVIGGVTVTLAGNVTLQGLADAINDTDGIGVTASIVSAATNEYQLVLTGTTTGSAGAFTIQNQLAGTTVAFTDTDADGTSGDSAADNAMQATNAQALINNVLVTSATNRIENAIPGATLDLLRKQPGTTVTVSVAESTDATSDLVKGFVDAYNALITYAQQSSTASSGITRDPLFRSLRNELRTVLTATYASGGSLASAGQVGIEFDRTGKVTINSSLLSDTLTSNPTGVRDLFMGDGVTAGLFDTLKATVERYTDPGGLLASTKDRIDDQVAAMDRRLADMEERLANRRAALQKEYIAADMLIGQLNSQAGSLSSLGNQYSLF